MTPKLTRKLVSVPEALAHEIDDFRFGNRFKNESDAMRVLIEAGLKAIKARNAHADH